MTLIHTPSRVTTTPESFTDPLTGRVYLVFPDDAPYNPWEDIDPEDSATLVIATSPLNNTARPTPDNVALQAFVHYRKERSLQPEDALAITKRYLRVFYPDKPYDLELRTITGYSQGDWWTVVAAVREGYGKASDAINTLRSWMIGDVWTVIVEGREDHLDGRQDDIYAESAQEAVQIFRRDEGPVPTLARQLKDQIAEAVADYRLIYPEPLALATNLALAVKAAELIDAPDEVEAVDKVTNQEVVEATEEVEPENLPRTYTAIGFWNNSQVTIVGIVEGEHDVFGGDDPEGEGQYATSVTLPADTPESDRDHLILEAVYQETNTEQDDDGDTLDDDE